MFEFHSYVQSDTSCRSSSFVCFLRILFHVIGIFLSAFCPTWFYYFISLIVFQFNFNLLRFWKNFCYWRDRWKWSNTHEQWRIRRYLLRATKRLQSSFKIFVSAEVFSAEALSEISQGLAREISAKFHASRRSFSIYYGWTLGVSFMDGNAKCSSRLDGPHL